MHRTLRAPQVAAIAVALTLACASIAATSCGEAEVISAPVTSIASAAPVRTVVLITVDTLRADALGAYGGMLAPTPSFDELAARGALFEHAIAAASSTIPSHATMMTGLPPRRHSIGTRNGDTRLEGTTTVAQCFQDAGWETAAFVSNAVLERRSGLASGFAHYDEELPAREGLLLTFERHAPATVEAALHWIGKHTNDRIFLWVHLQDPHGPYTAPDEWLERIPVVEVADEVQLEAKKWDNPLNGIPAYQAIDGLDRPSQYARRYAAEVAYADAALGRLIEGLKERGDTAIVFTSDHGESFGEGGRWFQHGHASTIDLARVPLLVVAPGVATQRRPELAGHVDVAPTLLEFAGILPLEASASENFGVSLVGPLRNQTALPDRTLFCDSKGEASAYSPNAHVRATGFGERTAAQAVASLESGDPTALQFSGISAGDGGVGGNWTPRVDSALTRELTDYLRNEVAVAPATPNPETSRPLRALGYLGGAETPSAVEAVDLAPVPDPAS